MSAHPSIVRLLRFSTAAIAGLTLVSAPAHASAKPGYRAAELEQAVGRKDRAAVRALLAKGADPNGPRTPAPSLLINATFGGDAEIVRSLLNAGADAKAQSPFGSPLTAAFITKRPDLARLLLSHGAPVETSRPDNISLVMMAARDGQPEVLLALLHRGARVDTQDLSGMTALMHAARQGQAEAVRILLRRGASVRKADREGFTPLVHAAVTGHAACIRLLLQAGADVEARDRLGRTPLLISATYGDHPAAVHALLAGGAAAEARDPRGRTALALAAARGYGNTARLLNPGASPLPAAEQSTRTPAEAAAAGFSLMERTGQVFVKRTGCASCHHEGLTRFTLGFARRHGFPAAPAFVKAQSDRVRAHFAGRLALHRKVLKDPRELEKLGPGPSDLAVEYSALLTGLDAHDEPGSESLGTAALLLARLQSPAGNWRYDSPRGPMQSSHFTITALTIRAIKAYAPAENAAEVEQRLARARRWLRTAAASNAEDRAFRLLGLRWSGASEGELAAATRELRAAQRPDGGWAETPGGKTDAYATGQALFALHQGGDVPAADPDYQRGARFLLRTQMDDGSWFVNKQVMPGNFYFDTGFPHGQSQYISQMATGWASAALLLAAESPGAPVARAAGAAR